MNILAGISANGLTSMFSRLLHGTRSILSQSKPTTNLPLTSTPDQQLQTELIQALEGGMVATRSQDHTLDDVDVQDLVDQTPLSTRSKKRKVDGGEDVTPDQAASKKRKRTSSKDGVAATTNPSTPAEDTSVKRSIRKRIDDGDNEPSQGGIGVSKTKKLTGSASIASKDPYKNRLYGDGDEGSRLSVADGLQEERMPELGAQRDNKDVIPYSTTPQTTKRRRKPPKTQEVTQGFLGKVGVSEDKFSKIVNGKAPPAVKATKKRFGSEDIEIPITVSQGAKVEHVVDEVQSEARGDSEDEAPETVTASAGLEKARAKALEAAETVARFEADQKIKRKERDSRLKTQAKSAKKYTKLQGSRAKSPDLENALPEATTSENIQKSGAKAKVSAKAPLPSLLPDEILAAEPIVRPPTPPPSASKTAVNKKQKFLDVDSRPLKDVKRGNLKIRVLQQEQSSLPPKASQTSKALRESWLAGRPGFKGDVVVPRRKLGNRFVRK